MASALIDASALAALFGCNPPEMQKYDELLALASLEHWALATTWPCVVKACRLITPPGRFALLNWLGKEAVAILPFEQTALLDLAQLMKQHTQSDEGEEMDLAEASLYRLAVETGVTRIMTLDGPDFSRYRLPNGESFEIL